MLPWLRYSAHRADAHTRGLGKVGEWLGAGDAKVATNAATALGTVSSWTSCTSRVAGGSALPAGGSSVWESLGGLPVSPHDTGPHTHHLGVDGG